MQKSVTISIKELNVLRETFKKANEIINRLGSDDGGANESKAIKEPSQSQKVKNYSELLSTNTKYKKPKHLTK
jgi:hypothetical protein